MHQETCDIEPASGYLVRKSEKQKRRCFTSTDDMNHVYLPGDTLLSDDNPHKKYEHSLTACIAVELPIFPYKKRYCGSGRLYIPCVGDIVLGVITKVTGEHYKVDIQGAFDAILPVTAFNNATKQKRPFFQVGTLVVASVVAFYNEHLSIDHTNGNKIDSKLQRGVHAQVELSCVDPHDSRSWSTGEVYFGEIQNVKEGYFFNVPLPFVLSLQANDCYVLDRLGSFVAFESVVGINGRVWVRGSTLSVTQLVSRVIQNAYGLSLPDIENLILSSTSSITPAFETKMCIEN